MESQSGRKTTDDVKAVVLRIERMSIFDGPGLRTVVFLKGCHLNCQWCSTPESQIIKPEKGFLQDRCRECGSCIENCKTGALSMIEGRVVTDHSLCSSCFECVDICPHDAHKSFGQEMTDSQVFDEISKDEVFFFHSGGGVTISGGECLCQPDFVISVLKKCRIRGIFTAIETSLSVSWEIIENVLPFIDNLYVDIKHLDTRMHKKFVGVNNKLILSNLEKLDRSELPFDLHIRIPLIPGVNDDDASLLALIPVMKSLKRLTDIEILPYHRLGVGTYAQLGKDYKFEGLQPPTEEYIAERIEFLSKQELTVPLRIAGGA